jgi:phosphoribosylformylglycinamidine cyclo-ligase
VGTKTLVAAALGRYDTVGQDLVNHCINDILAQGARPLFFMDYIAMAKLNPRQVAEVVSGCAAACRAAGCALLGGETAEMPDVYHAGAYDLAGTIVGVVERARMLPRDVTAGDAILALPSSGLHTNGYSLARKIFFEKKGLKPSSLVPELGRTVGEELLSVHRSYLPVLRDLIPSGGIYGLAHITGGGFTDNIPRILPKGVSAQIELGSWPVPPVFRYLRREGRVADPEMLRTFNMGIGMVVVVPAHREAEVRGHFERRREKHWRIGEIVTGGRKVIFTRGGMATDDWTVATPA